MKYLIIALAIVATILIIRDGVVIRGAGGDQPAQLSQIELQGPQPAQWVLMPDGDAIPYCTPLRGCVGGHWELL